MVLKKYMTFCIQAKLQVLPPTEGTFTLFVMDLAQQQLSYGTTQVCLSAVHYYHITNHKESIFATQVRQRMCQVLKGICWSHAFAQTTKTWQPITFLIMQCLHSVIISQSSNYFDVMVWASYCMAYFDLLRVSEFTTQSPNQSNSTTSFLILDVAFDSHITLQLVRITLWQSKTDQFKQGTHLYLEKTGDQVCPVMALIQYLARWGDKPGPLFILLDNKSSE